MLNISEISIIRRELQNDDAIDVAVSIDGDLYGKVIYRFPVSNILKYGKHHERYGVSDSDSFRDLPYRRLQISLA